MRLLRGLSLLLGITCLVWVGVLWHWQTTRRDMSGTDIALYLGALPLTLFVLLLMGRWAWQGAAARAAQADSTVVMTAPGPGAPGSTSPPGVGAAQVQARAKLLAAHLKCPAGASAQAVAEAAATGRPRPGLHPHWVDGQGLPVITAALQGLATDSILHALQAVQQHTGTASSSGAVLSPPSEGLVRALALLDTPLAEAVAALAAWPDRLRPAAPTPGVRAPALAHHIRVLAAWPEHTHAGERALAQAWLSQRLQRLSEGTVDPAAWLPPMSCTAAPGQGGTLLWTQAEQMLAAQETAGHQDLVLVLACHSDLHEQAIDRLDQGGRLFSAARPHGVVPGEGAAVLLLASPEWPAPAIGSDGPTAEHCSLLYPAQIQQGDASGDAHRLNDPLALATLLTQAMAAGGVRADEVAGLAADADPHSRRTSALFSALVAALPHLDAAEAARMTGAVCGRTGAAGTLMAVALAARQAAESGRSWLAFSLGDNDGRLALLARPAPNPPPGDPATAPEGAPQATPS